MNRWQWRLFLLLIISAAVQRSALGEWPELFAERAEVTVVELQVVVIDSEGRAVKGLEQDDFELRVDGELVGISNFFAVEGALPKVQKALSGVEPTVLPKWVSADELIPLQIVFFFDQSNLDTGHRERLLNRIRKLILEQTRQGAQYMLVSHDREMEVRQRFTPTLFEILQALDNLSSAGIGVDRLKIERSRIVRALERIPLEGGASFAGEKGIGLRLEEDEEEASEIHTPERRWTSEARVILPQIQAYSQQRFEVVERSLSSLARVVEMIEGLPGRKMLLYVGGGLPMRSGEELFHGYAARVAALPGLERDISPEAEASRYDSSFRFRELTALANAAGVSFYTVDAASSLAELQGSAAGGETAFRTSTVSSIGDGNRQSSLLFMAEMTGGLAALGPAAIDPALGSMFRDARDHYSLGFLADDLPVVDPSKNREIEVSLREQGFDLRYRRTWKPRTNEQEMASQAVAALLSEGGRNPLGIALSAGQPQAAEDGAWIVPITVELPLDRVVLLPGRESHRAELRISLVVADPTGAMSEVVHRRCPLEIPNSEILVALGRSMGCGLRLRMQAGRQSVAVAARDEVAGTEATIRVELEVGAEIRGIETAMDSM